MEELFVATILVLEDDIEFYNSFFIRHLIRCLIKRKCFTV